MFDKKIFFSSGDNSGCFFYRVKVIAEFLQQNYCAYFPLARTTDGTIVIANDDILNSDIIVLQRHVDPVLIEPLKELKKQGKKLVYDIDDDLWTIPATNIASRVYNKKMLQDTVNIIQLCDAVTVSTEHLKKCFLDRQFHDNIYIIPNMLTDDIFEVKKEIREDNRLRVGWAGSNSHVGDFDHKLMNTLRDIGKRDDVQLVFMGYVPSSISKYPGLEFHTFVKPEEYYQYFTNLHLDIAFAPLEDVFFNKSKSAVKFLEYSAMKVPVIASNVLPYSNMITDGENGILIKNIKEWAPAFKSLIESEELRDKISTNAYNFVLENYSYKNAGYKIVETWNRIIEDLYK